MATLAVLLTALATVGSQATIILFVLLGVATLLQNQLLRPIIYGRSIHLHPAVILIALPIAGYVAGMIGLFAALPVIAFVAAIGGTVLNLLELPVRDDSRVVSGWLDRVAQWSWRALAIIGVVAVVVFLIAQVPLVITPIVVAAVIAASVAPLAEALQRRGWSASRAARRDGRHVPAAPLRDRPRRVPVRRSDHRQRGGNRRRAAGERDDHGDLEALVTLAGALARRWSGPSGQWSMRSPRSRSSWCCRRSWPSTCCATRSAVGRW